MQVEVRIKKMNNNTTILHLLLKNDTFRFNPKSCRSANISVIEAKLLRWLLFDDHSHSEVIQNFGLGIPYKLLKQGFVENPLGDTNVWKLSADGLELLKTITGVKS
jgi:hypothetical protein